MRIYLTLVIIEQSLIEVMLVNLPYCGAIIYCVIHLCELYLLFID